MAYIQYEALIVTVTTGGVGLAGPAATSYSAKTYNGFLHGVRFVNSTAGSSMAEDTILAIASEKSGDTVLNIASCTGTQTWYPRASLHNTTGAVLSTGAVAEFPLADERLAITITSGSTSGTRTGTFYFWVS